jgi:hypothetical protein
MVWRRMGLLDDAIRDHLELKRLRGADPGEVAREQKEALTPILTEEDAAPEEDHLLTLEDFNVEPGPAAPELSEAPEADPEPPSQLALGAELPAGGQETAEIDMQTVLGADDEAAHEDWDVAADAPAETPADSGERDRAIGGHGG